MKSSWSVGLAVGAASAVSLASVSASAHVRMEGKWPDADKTVSLEATKLPRSEALRKLADAAGWSLVMSGASDEPIDLHIKGQPAGKVLELLLEDGDFTAKRTGTMVRIERDEGPAAVLAPEVPSGMVVQIPPSPPIPVVPPMPPMGHGPGNVHPKNDRDRTVMGGNVHIAKTKSPVTSPYSAATSTSRVRQRET